MATTVALGLAYSNMLPFMIVALFVPSFCALLAYRREGSYPFLHGPGFCNDQDDGLRIRCAHRGGDGRS